MYEDVAEHLRQAIITEFSEEGFSVIHDRLHPSLENRKVTIGISPDTEAVAEDNFLVKEMTLLVQFYDHWDRNIDPYTSVNPTKVTNYAKRFKEAIKQATDDYVGTDEAWFFNLLEIEYPDDPTGNKTRFEAKIKVTGNNSSLVETSG